MSDNPKIHFDLPTGVQATDLMQVFTSKPYPVIAIDAMTSRGGYPSLRFWSGAVDALAPAGDFTSIGLRPVLLATTVEPDAATAGPGEFTSLEFKTVLKRTTVEPDATTAGPGEFTSIELRSLLVSYEHEPDAITVAGEFTGINLS